MQQAKSQSRPPHIKRSSFSSHQKLSDFTLLILAIKVQFRNDTLSQQIHNTPRNMPREYLPEPGCHMRNAASLLIYSLSHVRSKIHEMCPCISINVIPSVCTAISAEDLSISDKIEQSKTVVQNQNG